MSRILFSQRLKVAPHSVNASSRDRPDVTSQRQHMAETFLKLGPATGKVQVDGGVVHGFPNSTDSALTRNKGCHAIERSSPSKAIHAAGASKPKALRWGIATRRAGPAREAAFSRAIDKTGANRSRRRATRDRDVSNRRALDDLRIMRPVVEGLAASVRLVRKVNRHVVDPNTLPGGLATADDAGVDVTAVHSGIETPSFQSVLWVKRNVSVTAAVLSARWIFAR